MAVDEYSEQARRELAMMGFPNADKLTDEQADELILPMWGPENYMCDGEISARQANQMWRRSLRQVGLTYVQIDYINKLYGFK